MQSEEKVENVQLAGWVKPDIARQLRALAAWRSVTIGELIEEMSAPLRQSFQITEAPAGQSKHNEERRTSRTLSGASHARIETHAVAQ